MHFLQLYWDDAFYTFSKVPYVGSGHYYARKGNVIVKKTVN